MGTPFKEHNFFGFDGINYLWQMSHFRFAFENGST